MPQNQTHPAVVWQRDVYDGLASTLGAAPIAGIARRFQANLGSRFADHDDRDGLRRDAHAIVSAAGMLGFVALSDSAKALEQACTGDGDLARPLATLLATRDATDQCLSDLLSGVPPESSRLTP